MAQQTISRFALKAIKDCNSRVDFTYFSYLSKPLYLLDIKGLFYFRKRKKQ